MTTHNIVSLHKNTLASINPARGELLREYDQHTNEDVEGKLQLAIESFREYRQVSFSQRSGMMARVAEILENDKEAYARLMTLEMGKTYNSALQEAEKCAFGCRFYAENAE